MLSAVSGVRWKKPGWRTHETIIAATPESRKATAMMNGGPMPHHEVPEAESAGFHRSIRDFTKM